MKEGNASLDEFQKPEPSEGPGYPGALAMDRNEWLPYLAEFEISEEQKIELLQTLWDIMTNLVYMGWGVDFVYLAIPALAEFNKQSNLNSAARNEAPQKDESKHDIPNED